jgi:hypothetical protein
LGIANTFFCDKIESKVEVIYLNNIKKMRKLKMKKLDYEVRELVFKEKLTNDELSQLIDKMNKKGFDYANYVDERIAYQFIKFNRA